MPRFIAKEDYKSVPWENGRGTTSDIVLIPDGSSRKNFDIRVSVAPITNDGPFSLFSGVDRHITLIKGAGLDLEFSSRSLQVRPLSPVHFDNGEPLFARLVDGPVEVFNLLTRRGHWTARVEILRQETEVIIDQDQIGIVFAAANSWIADVGGETHALPDGGTGIIAQPGAVTFTANAPAAAIFAQLTPGARQVNNR